jgi:hypothetical protein
VKNPSDDEQRFKITERVVLKKFEGELTSQEAEVAQPIEVLVVEDGVIVDRWTPDQKRPWPKS